LINEKKKTKAEEKKEMTKINNIYIEDFEKILEKSIIIEYNDSHIEIPGVIIFVKESTKSVINRLFNPSIEILTVKDEVFNNMVEAAKIFQIEGKKFSIKSKTKPIKTIIFNIKNLESQMVFIKKEENLLIVNDYLFTTKESDFHGETIFTSRKVYFLDEIYFNKIKDFLSVSKNI